MPRVVSGHLHKMPIWMYKRSKDFLLHTSGDTLAEWLMRWITNPFPFGAKVRILQVSYLFLIDHIDPLKIASV